MAIENEYKYPVCPGNSARYPEYKLQATQIAIRETGSLKSRYQQGLLLFQSCLPTVLTVDRLPAGVFLGLCSGQTVVISQGFSLVLRRKHL